MEKKIYVDANARATLRKVFDCSKVMVWKALAFQSDSPLARKIRYAALKEHGGVPSWVKGWDAREMAKGGVGACWVPDCETSFDHVEHTATQKFGERVKLVYDLRDNHIVVYVDGEVERRAVCEDIPAFMCLQREVELMAASV